MKNKWFFVQDLRNEILFFMLKTLDFQEDRKPRGILCLFFVIVQPMRALVVALSPFVTIYACFVGPPVFWTVVFSFNWIYSCFPILDILYLYYIIKMEFYILQ